MSSNSYVESAQDIKRYLDSEIQSLTKDMRPFNDPHNEFDAIEYKLRKLQAKLINLRDQPSRFVANKATMTKSAKVKTINDAQQNNPFIQQSNRKQNSATQEFNSPQKKTIKSKRTNIFNNSQLKRGTSTLQIRSKQKYDRTAGSLRKSKSEVYKLPAYFHKPTQMQSFTEKKKKRQNNLNRKTTNNKSQVVPKAQTTKIVFLEKKLNNFEKVNMQLQNQVATLKGYETEYWKMKQMFDKCERERKIALKRTMRQ